MFASTSRRIFPTTLALSVALVLLLPAGAGAEGTWSQRGSTLLGTAAEDRFGHALSLDTDGDTVAIGAPDNNGGGSDAGHVQILRLSAGSWSPLGSTLEGAAAEDYFGTAVSLSNDGTRVAVGAPFSGASDNGHVRVFEYSGGTWGLMGAAIDGEDAGE